MRKSLAGAFLALTISASLWACGPTRHAVDTQLRKADHAMKVHCGPDAEQAGAWREKDGEIIGSCYGR
jgi:hypothetical protein